MTQNEYSLSAFFLRVSFFLFETCTLKNSLLFHANKQLSFQHKQHLLQLRLHRKVFFYFIRASSIKLLSLVVILRMGFSFRGGAEQLPAVKTKMDAMRSVFDLAHSNVKSFTRNEDVHVFVLLMFAFLGAITYLSYWVPKLIVSFMPTQNLKRKYKGAKWALVTGASSGIGKSLAKELAEQGLNVILVSLKETILDETFEELKKQHPEREFRKIGVNLGLRDGSYLREIEEKTKDIDVQVVFNNAGFMLTGFFDKTKLDLLMTNHECNCTSAMQITHVFVKRMLEKKLKGCIVFTSSAAACQPTPFSALYGATKSYISAFAANVACEVKSRGIDVCAVHPSPVASNFYDKAHKLDALAFFQKFAVTPDQLPKEMLRPIGRIVWYDIGFVAIAFRNLLKMFDYGFFATLISWTAHTMGDYKKNV